MQHLMAVQLFVFELFQDKTKKSDLYLYLLYIIFYFISLGYSLLLFTIINQFALFPLSLLSSPLPCIYSSQPLYRVYGQLAVVSWHACLFMSIHQSSLNALHWPQPKQFDHLCRSLDISGRHVIIHIDIKWPREPISSQSRGWGWGMVGCEKGPQKFSMQH